MNWKLTDNPKYEVSDTGLVRHIGKRPVKPFVHKSGHLYVKWHWNGRRVSRQVHRLVLLAFAGPCPTGQECRHRDGDPTNNALRNLTWGTRGENIADYRKKHGRHHRAKTTLKIAAMIRRRFNGIRGHQTELAREYGLSIGIVNRIILRRIYL